MPPCAADTSASAVSSSVEANRPGTYCNDVLRPSAPSRIACATRSRIRRHCLGQRRNRSTLARDLGRDSLVNLAGGTAVHQERELRLTEHVDEAGRDHETGTVDDRLGVLATERTDGGDPVTGDAHVRVEPRGPGAVHHASAGNEEIELRSGGGLCARHGEGRQARDDDEYWSREPR